MVAVPAVAAALVRKLNGPVVRDGENAGPGVRACDSKERQGGSCNLHWTKTGFTDGIRARLLAKLDTDSLGTPVAHIFDPKKR